MRLRKKLLEIDSTKILNNAYIMFLGSITEMDIETQLELLNIS